MINKIKQFFAPLKIGRLDVGILIRGSYFNNDPPFPYTFRYENEWFIFTERGFFIDGEWVIHWRRIDLRPPQHINCRCELTPVKGKIEC